MNKISAFFLLLFAGSPAALPAEPLLVWPSQYSATMTTVAGEMKADVKIYVDGDKTRSDIKANGMNMSSIIRKDRKLMYNIVPAQKIYMEMPLNEKLMKADPNPMKEVNEGKAKIESVGTETIKGEICDKYKFTSQSNGMAETVFLWMSKSQKAPVRLSSEDGQTVIEWSNFKVGPPGSDLFEPPAGYQKMEMPAGFNLPSI